MRLIRTCPGLGDSVWIIQKLISSGEKFDFHISENKPQRGKQLFDMLPQVANSCAYVPGLSYGAIRAGSKQFDGMHFADIKMNGFNLEANYHLECGKRIEEFLPDLPTTYKLPYVTGDHGFSWTQLPRPASEKITNPEKGLPAIADQTKYVGIYGSAYSTGRAWGGWSDAEWFDLIDKMYCENKDLIFVIIGASWDVDLASNLIPRLRKAAIPYHNTVGKPMTYVVELLKCLDYFIGFPSGLSIINETLHRKTFMFYPDPLKNDLRKLMYSWPEQNRIDNHDYIAQTFCPPIDAFNLIKKYANLL